LASTAIFGFMPVNGVLNNTKCPSRTSNTNAKNCGNVTRGDPPDMLKAADSGIPTISCFGRAFFWGA
jgi:hypothetical protein